MAVVLFIMGMMTGVASGASIGYIDGQKVFSSYDKTKKAQEQFKKKEQVIQDEITKNKNKLSRKRPKARQTQISGNWLKSLKKNWRRNRKILSNRKTKYGRKFRVISSRQRKSLLKNGIEIVLDKQILLPAELT